MPWAEGQSGNPGGRPKKEYSITAMLRAAGEKVVDVTTGQTRAQRLAEQLWGLAEGGDRQVAMYVIDRMDGKPKERVEHSESQVLRVTLEEVNGIDSNQGTTETETVHNVES